MSSSFIFLVADLLNAVAASYALLRVFDAVFPEARGFLRATAAVFFFFFFLVAALTGGSNSTLGCFAVR
jgi:hypothetical protein